MSDKTPLIREDVQGFLAMMNSLPAPERLDPAEQRAGYLGLKAMTEADPRPMAVIKDLTCPGPAGAIPVRFYDVRENREPSPVILFFHGGGFVIGDLDTHNSLCTELSAELDLPTDPDEEDFDDDEEEDDDSDRLQFGLEAEWR